MPKSSPDAPVLIQPVESPVICRPYYEPTHYWDYDRATGRANKRDCRRPAAYWYKFAAADTRRGQLSLELEEDRRELTFVNKLRADVKRWRNAGWKGATNVTKDLLRHWQRKDRARRFFFCQLEAAETMIFLNEIRGYRRDGQRGKPRWNPEFTDADFELLWRMADGPVEPLTRYACKMATGSGKTVVMAMLIAWAFCNRARVPSDDRFPNAVLVCCPNLTIKERLQVLRTDSRSDDYYTQFDLIPPRRSISRGAATRRASLFRGSSVTSAWWTQSKEEDEQDRAKYQAARRWITAVNNWGRLGVWDFQTCRDPHLLPRLIAESVKFKQ